MPLICSVFEANLEIIFTSNDEKKMLRALEHVEQELYNQEQKTFAIQQKLVERCVEIGSSETWAVGCRILSLRCLNSLCTMKRARADISSDLIYKMLLSLRQNESLKIEVWSIFATLSDFPDVFQQFSHLLDDTASLMYSALSLENSNKENLFIIHFLRNISSHFKTPENEPIAILSELLKAGRETLGSNLSEDVLQLIWNLSHDPTIREKFIRLNCCDHFGSFISADEAAVVKRACGCISVMAVAHSGKLQLTKNKSLLEQLTIVYLNIDSQDKWLEFDKQETELTCRQALFNIAESKEGLLLIGHTLKENSALCVRVLGTIWATEYAHSQLRENSALDQFDYKLLLEIANHEKGNFQIFCCANPSLREYIVKNLGNEALGKQVLTNLANVPQMQNYFREVLSEQAVLPKSREFMMTLVKEE